MPLFAKRQYEHYAIAIWNVTEELSFFADKTIFSANDKSYYQRVNNERRKREWVVVRYLLQNIIGIDDEIRYDENGRPKIKSHYISISHSGYMVVVIVSKYRCAVDIEEVRARISKVAHRVFSNSELSFAQTDEELTVLWCVKEAVFKLYGNGEVDFKHDIIVEPIKDFKSGAISCRFLKKNVLLNNLNLETIGNFKMVWIVDDLNICHDF
ncbi:MAG TPA: 4'-phosphopantetheinyl transferase superfamily protein [Salinivirgaceae bacterium]|nr:4'-phosphopantetheinyl transferase superfamily protein [Salinivirgaceae bacterium]